MKKLLRRLSSKEKDKSEGTEGSDDMPFDEGPSSARVSEDDDGNSREVLVHFENMVDLYEVPNKESFTDEEAENIWMQEADFLRIEFDNALALDVMENKDMSQAHEYDSNFIFCGRGLECVLPHRIDRRDAIKKAAWDAVLEEQRRQWASAVEDPIIIAKVYRKVSINNQVAAHYQGLADQKAVKELSILDAPDMDSMRSMRSLMSEESEWTTPQEGIEISNRNEEHPPEKTQSLQPRNRGRDRTRRPRRRKSFPDTSETSGKNNEAIYQIRSARRTLSPERKSRRRTVRGGRPRSRRATGTDFAPEGPEIIETVVCPPPTGIPMSDLWFTEEEINDMESQSRFIGKPRFYLRGFEFYTEEGTKRKQVRKMAIVAVLKEQERKLAEGLNPEEQLALVSKAFSAACVKAALSRGKKDGKIASGVHNLPSDQPKEKKKSGAGTKRRTDESKSRGTKRKKNRPGKKTSPPPNARSKTRREGAQSENIVEYSNGAAHDQAQLETNEFRDGKYSMQVGEEDEGEPAKRQNLSLSPKRPPVKMSRSLSFTKLNQLRPRLGPKSKSASNLDAEKEDTAPNFKRGNQFWSFGPNGWVKTSEMSQTEGGNAPLPSARPRSNSIGSSIPWLKSNQMSPAEEEIILMSNGRERRPSLGADIPKGNKFEEMVEGEPRNLDRRPSNSVEDKDDGEFADRSRMVSDDSNARHNRSSLGPNGHSSKRKHRKRSRKKEDRNQFDEYTWSRSQVTNKPSRHVEEHEDDDQVTRRPYASPQFEKPSSRGTNASGEETRSRPASESHFEKPPSSRRTDSTSLGSQFEKPSSRRSDVSEDDMRVGRSDPGAEDARVGRPKSASKEEDTLSVNVSPSYGMFSIVKRWLVQTLAAFRAKTATFVGSDSRRGFGPNYTRRSYSNFEEAKMAKRSGLGARKSIKDGRGARPGFGKPYTRNSFSKYEDTHSSRRRGHPRRNENAGRNNRNRQRSPRPGSGGARRPDKNNLKFRGGGGSSSRSRSHTRNRGRMPSRTPSPIRGDRKRSRSYGDYEDARVSRRTASTISTRNDRTYDSGRRRQTARSVSPRRIDDKEHVSNSSRPSFGSPYTRRSYSQFDDVRMRRP